MVSTADGPAKNAQSKEEKLFLGIAIGLAVIAGLGCWIAAAAFAHKDDLRGITPDHARALTGFSLTNSTGKTVTRAELEGKVVAVNFLFTGCASICPEVSRQMARIQELTAHDPDVRLVSLAVDPRSDTPPVLAKWGETYGADTNRWLLLTGDKPQLHALIGTSFLATNAPDPFSAMPGNFTGTERIALVDKHGKVRIYFNGLRYESAGMAVAEIERLRREN